MAGNFNKTIKLAASHFPPTPNLSKSVLYILHGLFGNRKNWNSIAKCLSDDINVITCDLRNHGESGHLPDNKLTSLSDDIVKTMFPKSFISTVLAGHSLGGKVAMITALNQPNLIDKLICIDIAPKSTHTYNVSQILETMLEADLDKLSMKHNSSLQLVRKELNSLWEKKIDNEHLRSFILANLVNEKSSGNVVWKLNLKILHQEFNYIMGWPKDEVCSKTYDKPSLFIRGANSDFINNSDINLIKQYFPKATIETISNAGHWVHADNPRGVIDCIKHFIGNRI